MSFQTGFITKSFRGDLRSVLKSQIVKFDSKRKEKKIPALYFMDFCWKSINENPKKIGNVLPTKKNCLRRFAPGQLNKKFSRGKLNKIFFYLKNILETKYVLTFLSRENIQNLIFFVVPNRFHLPKCFGVIGGPFWNHKNCQIRFKKEEKKIPALYSGGALLCVFR